MNHNKKPQDEINEFMALGVDSMDNETKLAWSTMTSEDRKLIVSNAFCFVRSYNAANRVADIMKLKRGLNSENSD
jgi:hypothetical protein